MSSGGPGDAASAEVERMYGALLQGPRKLRPPEGMGLPLRTPQGTRALSEAIHGLLEGHMEYIHHAHHHLLPVGCSPALLSGCLLGPPRPCYQGLGQILQDGESDGSSISVHAGQSRESYSKQCWTLMLDRMVTFCAEWFSLKLELMISVSVGNGFAAAEGAQGGWARGESRLAAPAGHVQRADAGPGSREGQH